MKRVILVGTLMTIAIISMLSMVSATETQCHPQCSWKCDDPHCPAICDPVCEPPKCHTSCAEPKNAICDVKCEKPECEIKCPDKGCEQFDCPKCVTVCKQPHCVTHCQAPKPECEPVCEEPKCDWKCHKPNCPKPKCELVCENPNCVPKVDCCPCAMGVPQVALSLPFFKETETNQKCCGCGGNGSARGNFGAPSEIPQINVSDRSQFNTMPSSSYINNGHHLLKVDKSATLEMLNKPEVLGTGQLTGQSQPNLPEYEKAKTQLNLDILHKDRH